MLLSINVGLSSQVFIDFFKFGDLIKQSMWIWVPTLFKLLVLRESFQYVIYASFWF